jgi:hypothetical protein
MRRINDPWKNISPAYLAATIDRALIADHEEVPPSVPIAEVSLFALLAAAPSGEEAHAMAKSALEQ